MTWVFPVLSWLSWVAGTALPRLLQVVCVVPSAKLMDPTGDSLEMRWDRPDTELGELVLEVGKDSINLSRSGFEEPTVLCSRLAA